jgi:hypothetical protein
VKNKEEAGILSVAVHINNDSFKTADVKKHFYDKNKILNFLPKGVIHTNSLNFVLPVVTLFFILYI